MKSFSFQALKALSSGVQCCQWDVQHQSESHSFVDENLYDFRIFTLFLDFGNFPMTYLSGGVFWLFSSGIFSWLFAWWFYISLYLYICWDTIHILYYSSIKMYNNSMAFSTFTELCNYHNYGLLKFRIFTSPQKETLSISPAPGTH